MNEQPKVLREIDTIPRQVQHEDRKMTDKIWFAIYILSYLAFLVTGFTVVASANKRWTTDEFGTRVISSYYLEDAQQCCNAYQNNTLYENEIPYGPICYHLNENTRRLQDTNPSKFDGDEGIFDAFLMAPEIMIVMFLTVIGLSAIWILLLHFYAKPVILFIEVCKVAISIIFGIHFNNWMFYVIAAISAAYAVWARTKLDFAAKVISYSTTAMKENPSIFIGTFATKIIYALNAVLFVLFVSESFDAVEVKGYTWEEQRAENAAIRTYSYCEFQPINYVNSSIQFNCFAYLWTVLFLDSVRLSIVSTIVGSWHFHPEDKPTIMTAIKNVIPSIGTISISSLIATIADRLKKWILTNPLQSFGPMCFLTSPLRILACFCTVSLNAFVNTCTRFALITHVFTGKTYFQSGKSAFQILSRHFQSGVVTEVSSKSVLYVASYAFSTSITLLTWEWIANRFDCDNLSDLESYLFFMYFFFTIFVVYYPVLGLYVIILLDLWLRRMDRSIMDNDFSGGGSTNHIWIPPIAACFVGCLAMMIFSFFSALFLDISDTLFLCFAIDKDHNVRNENDELKTLMEELPGYINADYVMEGGDNDDPEEGKKVTPSVN